MDADLLCFSHPIPAFPMNLFPGDSNSSISEKTVQPQWLFLLLGGEVAVARCLLRGAQAFLAHCRGRVAESVWWEPGVCDRHGNVLQDRASSQAASALWWMPFSWKCACWEEGEIIIFIFFGFVKEPIVHETNKGEMHIKMLGPVKFS